MLSTISEKDALIGSLEFEKSPDNKSKIKRLYEEKDQLHQKLKDLVIILKNIII